MCISVNNARLWGTSIANVADFNLHHHHLFYQNKVENLSSTPNAMILPVPGIVQKLHDTSAYGKFLDEVVEQLKPRGRGMFVSKSVSIEDVGMYTIVRARVIEPAEVESALLSVSSHKRPYMKPSLLGWYRGFYGKNTELLICCFDSKEATKPQPIWVQYEPHHFSKLFFPGADSHNGEIPNIGGKVERDHHLIFGTVGASVSAPRGSFGRFSESKIPETLISTRWQHLDEINGQGINGDWIYDIGNNKLTMKTESLA